MRKSALNDFPPHRWFRNPTQQHNTVRHLWDLASLNLQMIDKLDLLRRTSESARLYGIDFFSVLTRGSQYRVEASLMRSAHRLGYILISPSKHRVANQAPMEVIPLVMEPLSRFYHDPVVVLDFQALYPSMIIAYNLCYSTIIGKLVPKHRGPGADTTGRLGVIDYPEKLSAEASFLHWINAEEMMHHESTSESCRSIDGDAVEGTKRHNQSSLAMEQGLSMDDVPHDFRPYVAPNGSAFCSKKVRLGILPQVRP